jgi:branched-chain amino acid transport system substrate-binding protein
LVGGIVVSLLLVAGCSDDSATTTGDDATSTEDGSTAKPGATDGESLLGPVDKAEGEPVRIGFVGDGQSAAGDNQVELDVAAVAVDYLNEYKAGIAGRPIELITCEAQSDPARATDCGNQMVEKEVVLVAVGATGVYESVWQPLHEAGIPTVFFAASGETILGDAETSFTFGSPSFSNIDFPISVAEEEEADKVTAVVIDTPAAVEGYDADDFEAADLDFDLIRVPIGTADMTPQLQGIVGDAGVVHIVGNDTFCISALQALEALGFDGPITMLNFCLSDATRQAFPDGFLEGIEMPLTAPTGDDDASALYREAMETYASGEVDFSLQLGVNVFVLFAGIDVALDGLEGEVTPAAAIETMKSMDEAELPGGGGIRFRCDGTAEEEFPAVCVLNGLFTTLDDAGQPTTVSVTD